VLVYHHLLSHTEADMLVATAEPFMKEAGIGRCKCSEQPYKVDT
jgi:hypothetical protein